MTTQLTAPPILEESPARPWPPPQGLWTYQDYRCLPDDGISYEIIEGKLYMAPAPRPKHQRVIAALFGYLWDFLQDHPQGEAFLSPIDLILPGLASPVQPDVLFITQDRLGMVKEEFIEGVPDLIVEVLSPTNPAHDRRRKFQLYARAGVREYWIVDPDDCRVDVYVLRGRAYAPLGNFGRNDQTASEVLPAFSVRVGDICPD
ncbi:MAG: Uma2 family endonuclease [Chloroflexota bacterium]